MPAKNKKVTSPIITNKAPVRKFVVEEKSDTDKKDVAEEVNIPESIISAPIETSEVESVDTTSVKSSDEKPKEEPELKSDIEKDTLPSANLTSFSLLDSDKKESEEKTSMQENIKESSQNESMVPSTSNDAPPKSSQDEVNKWIENYDDKEVVGKKKGSGFFKIFLIILTILSLVAVIAGGVYYYQKNIAGEKKEESKEETTSVSETPNPTATPTAEPTKEEIKVDYTKYTLQILNGSGVPGEAGKAKDLLTSLKFKSVVAGNAANYDYKKTIVSLKEGVPDQVLTDIKKALESTYELETKTEVLSDTSKYDVVVTAGTRK